jgi:hypothetical protein
MEGDKEPGTEFFVATQEEVDRANAQRIGISMREYHERIGDMIRLRRAAKPAKRVEDITYEEDRSKEDNSTPRLFINQSTII